MPRPPIGSLQLLINNVIVTFPRIIKHEDVLALRISVQDCLVILWLAFHLCQYIVKTLQKFLSPVGHNSKLDDYVTA
jgi:hypothetical protein